MALYNATGRYPDNWNADIVSNGEFVGTLSSFRNENGLQTVRVRDNDKKVIREFTAEKGHAIAMVDLDVLSSM